MAENILRVEPNETKNKDGMEAPLSPTLALLLQPMVLGRKPHEPLFRVVKYDFRRAWLRITTAAGIPTRTTKKGHVVASLLFHDLRRTSARLKTKAGVSSPVVKKS